MLESMVTLYPDAAVLGNILLLQNGIPIAPDERRIAEMAVGFLTTIPGVESLCVCLDGKVLASTASVKAGDCDAVAFDPRHDLYSEAQEGVRKFPLATPGRDYGELIFRLALAPAFDLYAPFIANTANLLALHLENRRVTRDLKVAAQRLEEVASARGEQYKLLFETMTEGVVYLDATGKVLSMNPAAQAILGRTCDEMRQWSAWDARHEDGSEFMYDEHPAMVALRTGETVIDVIMAIARPPEDEEVWLSVNAVPQRMPGMPCPHQVFITLRDITHRKRAEAEILRLNASLERRVAERTAELTAANRDLESFAYVVSHDLRSPLRAMNGFAYALIEDYGDQLTGEAKIFLDEIGNASRKMGALIDGILALSRSTQGGMLHDRVDISLLASVLLQELAQSEPDRKVDWLVEPGLQVNGDARMVEAVLRNLLGNAWKYTSHKAESFIRVFSGEVGGLAGICVEDNGAGFDMAHCEQLFQPFRRLHRQDEFPGLGIGLATVLRIVRRHGGDVRAVGRPGEGATFCFSLK